jgi:hypothetical protein
LALCACGCGQPTTVITRNNASQGDVKGQSRKFLKGHHLRVSAPWFKGDEAGYGAIHRYLRQHFPKSGICDECGQVKPTEYALIKGRTYSRNREDYRELCKLCHNRYDQTGGSRWRGVMTARKRAGDEPPCQCGCGQPAGWDNKHGRWRRFAPGHYSGKARSLVQKGVI